MADSAAETAQRWRAITFGEPALITTIITYYNDAMPELDLRKYVVDLISILGCEECNVAHWSGD